MLSTLIQIETFTLFFDTFSAWNFSLCTFLISSADALHLLFSSQDSVLYFSLRSPALVMSSERKKKTCALFVQWVALPTKMWLAMTLLRTSWEGRWFCHNSQAVWLLWWLTNILFGGGKFVCLFVCCLHYVYDEKWDCMTPVLAAHSIKSQF